MVLRGRLGSPDATDFYFAPCATVGGAAPPYTTWLGNTLVSQVGVDVQAATSAAAMRPSAIFVFMVWSFAVGLARVEWRRVTTR